MTKLAVLFAVCLVVFFAAAISAASITMEFVGEFQAGRPAIVRVTTTDIDLSNTVTIDPKVPTGDDAGKTYWATYIEHGQPQIVMNMNFDVLQQNNFLVVGDSAVVCVDEATHRPLVNLNYHTMSTMTFKAINSAHSVGFPTGKYGSFTFLCPMSIDTSKAYEPEMTTMTAGAMTAGGPTTVEFTLAPPVAWSWRQPLITINSASYSANTGNLLGGKVKFQFSTDTAGIHHVSIRNGPQPIYYNRRTQEFTSYQCGDKVEAYIISGDGLEIHVKDSAANGAPITCTVDVNGYMDSAFTERSQVVIEMNTVLVAQGIDFPVLDAIFVASVKNFDAKSAKFKINASKLSFSASPLHTNSTVEIRFTGVDVNTIQSTNTEYRQDTVCSDSNGGGLKGTFSHDGKSVFIKDVSQIGDSFSCIFKFAGTQIVRLDEFTPVPTVQVLIDGVSLYNRAVRSTSFPLYLPVNTGITQNQVQIYQDDSTIKHVVQFSLSDQSESSGVVPQKPILVLSYDSPATWPTASYADVLSCEATSPSSSAYTPLVTSFDMERRTWTADLSSLIDTDAYKINFRCTRSEAVVTKFDIVQNTANQLNVFFLDLVSGTGYISSQQVIISEQSPKTYLQLPTNPAVPTDFTQYFSFTSTFLITDFATASSVADDVSTKVLAAIKAGYDAYDATSPPTPAKLSPKLVNKAHVVPFDLISSSGLNSSDYSPSFAQIIFNLYYTILGFQFQPYNLKSIDIYGPIFSDTAHSQRTTPQIAYSQSFTSGSTYDEIQALSGAALDFAVGEMGSAFYKDAFSTSPAIPFTFDSNGFQFASLGPLGIMNPVTACGYYQVAYAASYDGSKYEFVYQNMAPSNMENQSYTRFTCGYAEACSSDADCDSGYCSNATCAAVHPFLKYPYVQYDSVKNLSEYDGYNYDGYNNSVVASLSAAIVAVIVAIAM